MRAAPFLLSLALLTTAGMASAGAEEPVADTLAKADRFEFTALDETLDRVQKDYVDPTRVKPRAMLEGALDEVQREIAEVMIRLPEDEHEVTVQVSGVSKTFPLADVDAIEVLRARTKEILSFIRANVHPGSGLARIEYTAINGMLGTLDPHSNIFDPEEAREFGVNMSGKFGGLGIVIRVRKDPATGAMGVVVVDLIAGDTPARRAGIAARDRIVRINDESTENLTSEEAVNRLRGDPDTKVTLLIQRAGSPSPISVTLSRSVIQVSSVRSRLLPKRVGYLRVDQFSKGVASDVRTAMDDLRRQGARAWVLDLRYNVGGLLAEATQLADFFLGSGTIVTTVSGSEREEKHATAAPTDDGASIAVLVNGSSASAAEVLAGALKYLDRAVVIGTTTFGKGSVQVLFDDSDGSQLKLTVAQYLTARDVSLQSAGIVPDVEVDRVFVPAKLASYKDVLRLSPPSGFSESDLSRHLVSDAVRSEKPSVFLSYLGEQPRDADDPDVTFDQDDRSSDFESSFARDLVASSSASRPDLIRAADRLARKARVKEDERVAEALGKLGVDWKAGSPDPRAKLTLELTTDKPDNRVVAGDSVAITGVVRNTGTATAYRARVRATSDDDMFDGAELVFGRVAPGATQRATIYVPTRKDAESRLTSLRFTFDDPKKTDGGTLALSIAGLPRPQFAFSYRLLDADGKGVGSAPRGQSMRLQVHVENTGQGGGQAATAMLKSASGDRVVVSKGRFELPSFEPAQSRDLDFTFAVKPEFDEKEIVLRLSVFDADLGEGVERRLVLPVSAASGNEGAPAAGRVSPPAMVLAGSVLESSSDHWEMSGRVRDDDRVEDVFALVSNSSAKIEEKKVFYAYNPQEANRNELDFSGSIPLWPGSNRITIVARENDEVHSVRTVWIYRETKDPQGEVAKP